MVIEKIQSISLDLCEIKEIHLKEDVFRKMYDLIILEFYKSDPKKPSKVIVFEGFINFLSEELRILYWEDYPMPNVSLSFCANNLMRLEMLNSNLQKLWDGDQHFSQLRAICLTGFTYLIQMPDFSKAPNINKIDLQGTVSYDIVTGVSRQYIIPAPAHLTDHTLAECDGRIILVGLLTKNAASCVCVWELQKMTLLWKEVDRMPNIWCLDFYGKHVRMTFLGNKGVLMLSWRSRQMNRLVTYNMACREWVKVPSCVVPRGRKRIACWTAFHPSLIAIA